MTRSRPSARPTARIRLPRAWQEFVAVPVLTVGVLLALALASIVGDQGGWPVLVSTRGVISHLIGDKAASTTLGAIATGLVTVTSITFSVLLLAVQQTASNLSPVVFDQFIRRRSNQVLLGLFVGLTLYAYVVLAAVQDRTPPLIGAFLATVLTVVALGSLLFLVYSTIDQMRPRNVMRQLHDRAVRAHEREAALVSRTRRSSQSDLPVQAQAVSRSFGYVEEIDLAAIAVVIGVEVGVEVELHLTLGAEVAAGDLIATIRHRDAAAAARIRGAVEEAIELGPLPDLDFDATTDIEDLSNIGWTSGSTSKQNPAVAAQSLHALRDLAARWVGEGQRSGHEVLPVVYLDDDVDTVLDAVYSALVVAHEAHQHQQASRVLDAYTALLRLASGAVRDRLLRDVGAMEPLLAQMPASPQLDAARARLAAAIERARPATG